MAASSMAQDFLGSPVSTKWGERLRESKLGGWWDKGQLWVFFPQPRTAVLTVGVSTPVWLDSLAASLNFSAELKIGESLKKNAPVMSLFPTQLASHFGKCNEGLSFNTHASH